MNKISVEVKEANSGKQCFKNYNDFFSRHVGVTVVFLRNRKITLFLYKIAINGLITG